VTICGFTKSGENGYKKLQNFEEHAKNTGKYCTLLKLTANLPSKPS
jgi:hypothetical protein